MGIAEGGPAESVVLSWPRLDDSAMKMVEEIEFPGGGQQIPVFALVSGNWCCVGYLVPDYLTGYQDLAAKLGGMRLEEGSDEEVLVHPNVLFPYQGVGVEYLGKDLGSLDPIQLTWGGFLEKINYIQLRAREEKFIKVIPLISVKHGGAVELGKSHMGIAPSINSFPKFFRYLHLHLAGVVSNLEADDTFSSKMNWKGYELYYSFSEDGEECYPPLQEWTLAMDGSGIFPVQSGDLHARALDAGGDDMYGDADWETFIGALSSVEYELIE